MINSISLDAKVERQSSDAQRKETGTERIKEWQKGQGTVTGNDASGDGARADVKEAAEKIVSTARFLNREIHLEIDRELDIMIVKVIDGETEKVIRQIPPEELVELSKNAQDLKGLLIDKEG